MKKIKNENVFKLFLLLNNMILLSLKYFKKNLTNRNVLNIIYVKIVAIYVYLLVLMSVKRNKHNK